MSDYDVYQDTQGNITRMRKIGTSGLGGDEGTPWLYKPDGWGADVYPKLAAAKNGTALFRAATWGDSIMQMYGASTWRKQFIWQWRDWMQGLYGNGGSGYVGVQYGPAATLAVDYPLQWTGTWSAAQGGLGYLASGTTNSTITWPAVDGSTISVWYLRVATGGTFEVFIDGVSKGITDTNAATTITKVQYAVSPGVHVVRIVVTNAANGVWIAGVEGTNPTGFVLDNLGVWGSGAALATTVAWGGAPANQTISSFALGQRSCDLFIGEHGGNDQTSGTAIATMQNGLMVAILWARWLNPKCAVLGMMFPSGTDAIVANWSYNNAGRQVYIANGAAFLDTFGFSRGTNTYQVAKGWTLAANPHINDAGNDEIFRLMKPLLHPIPLSA